MRDLKIFWSIIKVSCCTVSGVGGRATVHLDSKTKEQYEFGEKERWEMIYLGVPSIVASSTLKQYAFKNEMEAINIIFLHELSHWANEHKQPNDKMHSYVWNDFLRIYLAQNG